MASDLARIQYETQRTCQQVAYNKALAEYYKQPYEVRKAGDQALYEIFQCHRLPNFNCTVTQKKCVIFLGAMSILSLLLGDGTEDYPNGLSEGFYIAGGIGLFFTVLLIFKNCAYKNPESAQSLLP